MRRYGKKLTALLLALCMLLALAACGSGGDSGDAEQLSGTIYVPEFLECDLDLDYINSGCCDGRYVYVLGDVNTPQLYNAQGEVVRDMTEAEAEEFWNNPSAGEDGSYVGYASTSKIYRISIEDGAAEELENFSPAEIPEGQEGDSYISDLTTGADGTLWVTEQINTYTFDLPENFDPTTDSKWNYQTDYANTQIRRQLDSTGSELARVDTTGLNEAVGAGEDSYLDPPIIDNEGNFYVMVNNYTDTTSSSKIVVLDQSMKKLFEIDLGQDMWGTMSLLGDGTVGLNCSVPDEADQTTRRQVMRVIDVAAQDWGTEYDMPVSVYQIYPGGGKYLFYYQNGESIYGYDAETQEGTRLLNWIDSDINSGDLMFFTFLEDGRVAAMTRTYSNSSYSYTYELAILTETDASVLADKTILTYGCMYLDYDVRNAILEFNRSNTEYRIEVIDYSEYNTDEDYNAGLTRLNTEIGAGNVPDILATTNLPIRQYGAKDILEDLWPYIEGDTDLGGREALMENVLRAAEQEGKLYQIFSTFSVRTAVGATSVVGDRMSWTVADMEAALATMPDGCQLFGQGNTKEGMLSQVLAMNLDGFVDWDTGTCSFDSENFISLLEFCNTFPLEYDCNNEEYVDDATRVQNGQQMLMDLYLSDLADMQLYKAIFNGDFSFIGYPMEDGSVGSSFNIGSGMAMSTTCKDKEGAWSFMRELLLPQSDEEDWWSGYEFYVNKQDFDKAMEEAMTPEYELDENGDPVLDENGNPIEISTMGYGMGDIMVDIYATSQEEYDQFMALYNAIDSIYSYDQEIYDIVNSEAQGFFNGDKTAQDAARQIQSRVTLYINENL